MAKPRAERVKRGLATWGGLLRLCQQHGKAKVLKALEEQHRVYECREAAMWAEPEQHHVAQRLQATCLKQDETLIRLRQMTDEDIQKALEATT